MSSNDALEHATAVLSDQGADVIGVRTDVSSAESVEALASRAIEAYGAVHVLCNNAGVAGDLDFLSNRQARVWEQPIENWEWTLGVNLWGVVYGLRAFVPLMIEHGEPGHIVNTASQAGLMSGAGGVIYGVTKHSVVRITEALYQQLRLDDSPLSASVLCPGIIRTRIFSSGRNRPEDGQSSGTGGATASEEAAREADQKWQSDGLEPEEVADDVVRAIREQQLYVLTRDVPLDPNPHPDGEHPRAAQPRAGPASRTLVRGILSCALAHPAHPAGTSCWCQVSASRSSGAQTPSSRAPLCWSLAPSPGRAARRIIAWGRSSHRCRPVRRSQTPARGRPNAPGTGHQLALGTPSFGHQVVRRLIEFVADLGVGGGGARMLQPPSEQVTPSWLSNRDPLRGAIKDSRV